LETGYGVFILEPEWDHSIYHLSEEDQRSLCGRSVRRMMLVGTAGNSGGVLSKISVWYVGVWRCCVRCKKALERRREIEEESS